MQPARYRNEFVLDHVIRTQLCATRNRVTPVHFWRFRPDLSGVTPVFRETGHRKKRYDHPIPAYLNVNHETPKKPLTRAMVDEKVDSTFKVDIAECIRLGEVFEVVDATFPFKFYLPKPGDVYQWNFSLFQIEDVAANYFYEAVGRFIIWEGVSSLLRGDVGDPNKPLEVLPSDPLVERDQWVM